MHVDVRLPLPDEQIFRYEAMDDILEITAQTPSGEFSNRELQELTGFGGPSVSKALSLLEAMELIIRRETGQKTLYRIDTDRLHGATDPLMNIPQSEFRTPLRLFTQRVKDAVSSLAGILCFGSVARGEADRTSDLDVFVLIAEDDELVSMRRTISDIKHDIETDPIDGQRYEFEVFVESAESARTRGAALRPLFQEGVTLYKTETLHAVTQDIFGGTSE